MTKPFKQFFLVGLMLAVVVGVLMLNNDFSGQVQAQTQRVIWCNPANTGQEDGLTKATGYNTLWEAMATMSSGDTVIISDGDWRGYPGMTISNWEGNNVPPSGTPGVYSQVWAETDWGVRLTELNFTAGAARSYIIIRGIVFGPGTATSRGGHNVTLYHSKIIRCGFFAPQRTNANYNTVSFGGSSYNLVEESIAWGGGRYKFEDYQGNHNVFRRCVARHDWYKNSAKAEQEGNFRVYSSTYDVCQNCISIDSDREEYYETSSQDEGDFYFGAGTGGADGNRIEGSIVIKGMYNAYYIGAEKLVNSVALGPALVGVTRGLTGAITLRSSSPVLEVENFLAYDYNAGLQHFTSNWTSGGTMNMANSIAIDVGALGGSTIADYIYYWNVTTGNYGANSTNANPFQNGLLYPVRVEQNSPLATAGSNGGPIGPTILKKIGRSGTLYGEPGWDEVTDEDLWPFPNEDKIKELMSETVEGVPGIYGFTAYVSPFGSPNTLTSYIWEYLGNQIPADIYGAAPQPQTCSQLGGVCYSNPCSSYQSCASQTGTCASGYCCQGVCTTPPVLLPDIVLTKGADRTEAAAGEEITYTITYTNQGQGTAQNIVITDNIPSGTTYVTGTATSGGAFNPAVGVAGSLTWSIASLPAGSSGTVSFRVVVE